MSDIENLYKDRKNFCVIALTGYTASGCSRLAEIMQDDQFYNRDDMRAALSIGMSYNRTINNNDIFFNEESQKVNAAISLLNFKRKYSICRSFIQLNYKGYTIIKYSKVIWLKIILELVKKSNTDIELKQELINILKDKFQPSTKHDNDYRELCTLKPWERVDELIANLDLKPLYEEIKPLLELQKDKQQYDKYNGTLANIFLGNDNYIEFSNFYNFINSKLFKLDYYSACFFYHRSGYQIRKCGSVLSKYSEIFDAKEDFSHIYDIVKLINSIIKGIRFPSNNNNNNDKLGCRVVIDSIRNSLEARFLKERYSAFYLIAVHDEENSKSHLRNKVLANYNYTEEEIRSKREIINLQIDKIIELGNTEQTNKDFENGKFASPNTQQCVADAEIHISNQELDENHMTAPYFWSMSEQWMKYASLILHPGLITPSSEERCMVVAYTAKFNSGCLSRQVGAVITNRAHTIKSIGWNDVPYGQTPCSLRSLYDFPKFSDNKSPELKYIYSEFERGNRHIYKVKISSLRF